ncbi:MAG: hypothetical protein KTR31_03615 [Myxococcales bacterium]|nr:hypothetical protein [Myxococcales bacterium]
MWPPKEHASHGVAVAFEVVPDSDGPRVVCGPTALEAFVHAMALLAPWLDYAQSESSGTRTAISSVLAGGRSPVRASIDGPFPGSAEGAPWRARYGIDGADEVCGSHDALFAVMNAARRLRCRALSEQSSCFEAAAEAWRTTWASAAALPQAWVGSLPDQALVIGDELPPRLRFHVWAPRRADAGWVVPVQAGRCTPGIALWPADTELDAWIAAARLYGVFLEGTWHPPAPPAASRPAPAPRSPFVPLTEVDDVLIELPVQVGDTVGQLRIGRPRQHPDDAGSGVRYALWEAPPLWPTDRCFGEGDQAVLIVLQLVHSWLQHQDLAAIAEDWRRHTGT